MSTPDEQHVYRRHSLLKRNSAHSRQEFSRYYEHHHGPLAAGLPGFRKFATRYIQNHVEDLPDGSEPPFDGVTMTTQVPRADYSRGFFNEPDYGKVKPDEIYLFDLGKTVSVLGWEEVVFDVPGSGDKALILAQAGTFDIKALRGLGRLVLNHLDRSTASALGFHSGHFDYDLLAEAWFEDGARDEAYRLAGASRSVDAPPMLLPVREVAIYGPEKPWPAD